MLCVATLFTTGTTQQQPSTCQPSGSHARAHRALHAAVGEEASQCQVGDAALAQDKVQVGGRKAAPVEGWLFACTAGGRVHLFRMAH
jgi:hypothetical protein